MPRKGRTLLLPGKGPASGPVGAASPPRSPSPTRRLRGQETRAAGPEGASRPPPGVGKERGLLSAPHSPWWSQGPGGRRVGARAARRRAAGVGRQPCTHQPHPAARPPRQQRRTRKLPKPRTDFRANRADRFTSSGGSDVVVLPRKDAGVAKTCWAAKSVLLSRFGVRGRTRGGCFGV